MRVSTSSAALPVCVGLLVVARRDAPWPSCTTLANTDANGDGVADHRYFGCAPALLP